MTAKPVILTTVNYYLPGYKSGGPLRSIANMVQHLQDEFDFRIVTRDRDLGDTQPYPAIERDRWQTFGAADILHVSPKRLGPRHMMALLRETPHDLLYLNSFLSPPMTAWPLLAQRLGQAPSRPTIIAPRGVFSPGALKLKKTKKAAYLGLTRSVGLYRRVLWHASTQHEEKDIRNAMGNVATHIASDLAQTSDAPGAGGAGALAIVFLARIVPIKNLSFALDVLAKLRSAVTFRIYGPIEDAAHWAICQEKIAQLPDHISVELCGPVTPDKVSTVLGQHDLMFFPTLSENFGHVIPEAMSVGTAVLLSRDTTPWRDLAEYGVGADLPLDSPDAFAAHIEAMAADLETVRGAGRQTVLNGYAALAGLDRHVADNRALFEQALSSR